MYIIFPESNRTSVCGPLSVARKIVDQKNSKDSRSEPISTTWIFLLTSIFSSNRINILKLKLYWHINILSFTSPLIEPSSSKSKKEEEKIKQKYLRNDTEKYLPKIFPFRNLWNHNLRELLFMFHNNSKIGNVVFESKSLWRWCVHLLNHA